MAEEAKQPAFPDMSNGIEYAKYTVEGKIYQLLANVQIPRVAVEEKLLVNLMFNLVSLCIF